MNRLRATVRTAALLLLCCCEDRSADGSAPASYAVEITDGRGRRVGLAEFPTRLVTLAPSATEILFAIDAGQWLIARDDQSDYPPEAKAIASIGSTFPRVNLELIAEMDPDLVIAGGVNKGDDIRALESIGIPVYTARPTHRLQDIYDDISALGRITNRSRRAAELRRELESKIGHLVQLTERSADEPRVFYELDATDPAKPWTAGADSFIHQMIELLGGDNIAAEGGRFYYQISAEEILIRDPEVIFLGSSSYGVDSSGIADRPGWNGIDAVKNNRVFEIDGTLLGRPGPRILIGLKEVARRLHPQLFRDS